MKQINIRNFDYLSNSFRIMAVDVKKVFKAGNRTFAVCSTHEKVKFCSVYDVLTGCQMPEFISSGQTVKDKVSSTVNWFYTNKNTPVYFDEFDTLNPNI